MGRFLPFLVPLFAELNVTTGALAAGPAGVAKAVNDTKQNLEETQRHNEKVEYIVLGKIPDFKP